MVRFKDPIMTDILLTSPSVLATGLHAVLILKFKFRVSRIKRRKSLADMIVANAPESNDALLVDLYTEAFTSFSCLHLFLRFYRIVINY